MKNWKDSWRALERAYAEGRVMSIGVSNFDVNLLNELLDFATIKPHVIQNFAEIGKLDDDVRIWCKEHDVLYQPYASIRNLDNLPNNVKQSLERIALKKNVSSHNIAIRFFLQSGTGVIPRSSNEKHLQDNLNVFNFELTPEEMTELGWNEEL